MTREDNIRKRRRFEATSPQSRAWIACGQCGSGQVQQWPRAMLRCKACNNVASRVSRWFKLVRVRHRRGDLLRQFPDVTR